MPWKDQKVQQSHVISPNCIDVEVNIEKILDFTMSFKHSISNKMLKR